LFIERGLMTVGVHVDAGMAALTRGDRKEAEKMFVNASSEDPAFGEAYNKVAAIHALRNEHVSCITFSTLALQRQPRHFGALAGQGLAFAAVAGRRNLLT
jgi:Tfp pilus assembly protein PilF